MMQYRCIPKSGTGIERGRGMGEETSIFPTKAAQDGRM
jgi:hypothetical protein